MRDDDIAEADPMLKVSHAQAEAMALCGTANAEYRCRAGLSHIDILGAKVLKDSSKDLSCT